MGRTGSFRSVGGVPFPLGRAVAVVTERMVALAAWSRVSITSSILTDLSAPFW